MTKLLTDPDPRVRLGAERIVLGLLHGRSVGVDPEGDEGRAEPGIDPEGVALRLANFVAAAVAGSPEALEGDPSEETPGA